MTGRLFNRRVSVTLARPQEGEYFKSVANAIVITDLRVVFSITKTLTEKPNDCTVTVYNLSEQSRNEFGKKPLRIKLEAGYKDDGVARLFEGDIRWGMSTLDGTDWVTKFQMGDGDRSFNFARISRSYKGGVNLKTAVKDVASSMGLRMPTSLDDIKEMGHQFTSGLSMDGPSQQQMSKLLKSRGFGWSIQDGTLQILRSGDVRQNEAIVVSPETGLVGTPDYGPPKEKGKPPILTAKMLLYPGLTPGGKIRMESRSVKGLFRLEKVKHDGDTHGPDWLSTFEARPL